MRLKRLQRGLGSGHGLKHKMIMGVIRVMSGHPAPDILRTLFYRPEFFGDPFSKLLQSVMRGPGEWTVGEREVFAAYASKLNRCVF